MTREEALKAAGVMLTYADGKTVEFRKFGDTQWVKSGIFEDDNLGFNFDEYEYRIKKEPTYRPFKDKEECWAEMQKHQPFGWVKQNETNRQTLTVAVNYICFAGLTLEYEEAFDEVKFIDGTPFGMEE